MANGRGAYHPFKGVDTAKVQEEEASEVHGTHGLYTFIGKCAKREREKMGGGRYSEFVEAIMSGKSIYFQW